MALPARVIRTYSISTPRSPASASAFGRWPGRRNRSSAGQHSYNDTKCASGLTRRDVLHFVGAASIATPPSVARAATSGASLDGAVDTAPPPPIPYHPDDPPTFVKADGRIVAIGDLHGDIRKAMRALQLARLVQLADGQPVWVGGNTVLVQLGDVLDRGDFEIAIIMLLRELDSQARRQGGAVYMLNGNHESLNVCGDFRYVTEGAFIESATVAGLSDQEAMNYDLRLQARLALYAPGGLVARELAKNPTVLIVNDTAFAHGGLLPLHVQYGLERMNAEVAAWMRADSNEGGGTAAPPFIAMGDSNSVMWNRQLSREHFASPLEKWRACNALQQALERVGASRLVVGHTPQLSGANCECEGQVWRIDVGMSYGVLNAGVQVLEISRQQDGSTQVVTLRDTPDAADADEYSDEEESSAAMYV